jgi:hypothetical protein
VPGCQVACKAAASGGSVECWVACIQYPQGSEFLEAAPNPNRQHPFTTCQVAACSQQAPTNPLQH